MSNAKYIGRVGGLAVALGVGMAVATTPGVAWADDTGSAGSGDTTGSMGSGDTTGTAGATTGAGGTTESGTTTGTTTGAAGASTVGGPQTDGDAAPGSGAVDAPKSGTSASTDASVRQVPSGVVLVTGGADLSSKSTSEPPATGDVGAESTLDDSTPPKRVADSTATEPEAPATAKAPVSSPRGGSDKRRRPVDEPTGAPGVEANTVTATAGAPPSRPQPAQGAGTPAGDAPDQRTAQQPAATTVSGSSVPLTRSVAAQATPVAATAQMTAPTTTTSPVSSVVADTLAWAGLSPSVPDPVAPVESPAMLALLAGWRRQSQQALTGENTDPNVADPQTSQTVDPMVTGDLNATGDQGDRQALADTSTMQLSAPVTLDAASAATLTSSAFVQVKASSSRTKPDTTAPTVSLTAPTAGATVSGEMTLSATASDNPGGSGVAVVQFKLDGANLGTEDTTKPYSVSWNTTGATNGDHILTAVARDAAGNETTSAPVTVKVDNAAPTVSFTAPANVSGTVPLSATATDNPGGSGVAGVQFKLDGANLGTEDTSSPYSVSWDTTTASNGTHTLTAQAHDAAGNTTTKTVSVTVDNIAPTVSFTAPANVSGTVPLSATATDNPGGSGVAGVQFKLDGANLGTEDTSSPYSVSWDTTTASNGTHTLTAQAHDAAGNTTTKTVSVTVANLSSADQTTITVGTSPVAVAVNGTQAYVANSYDNTVSVIDTNTNNVIKTLTVGASPRNLAASPYGTRVYVANLYDNTVSVIDTDTNMVVDTIEIDDIPVGSRVWDVAVSPDSRRVYVTASGGTVSVIDTTTHAVSRPYAAGPAATGIAVSPDGTRLYVATELWNSDIIVMDTATMAVIGTVFVGESYYPIDGAFTPDDGKRLYMITGVQGFGATSNDSAMMVIDTDPRNVTTYNTVIAGFSGYDLGGGDFGAPSDVAFSPDGSRAYVIGDGGNKIAVIDTGTNAVIGHITVNLFPASGIRRIAISPDGDTLYITDTAGNALVVVSADSVTPTAL